VDLHIDLDGCGIGICHQRYEVSHGGGYIIEGAGLGDGA